MNKIKFNIFLWNFSFYRMMVKKINLNKFKKILNNDKWILIDLNKITNEKIKNILKDDILTNLKNSKRFLLFSNTNNFIDWFNSNKDISKKYLFINKFFHCKYQYRFIRFNGFKSYLIK